MFVSDLHAACVFFLGEVRHFCFTFPCSKIMGKHRVFDFQKVEKLHMRCIFAFVFERIAGSILFFLVKGICVPRQWWATETEDSILEKDTKNKQKQTSRGWPLARKQYKHIHFEKLALDFILCDKTNLCKHCLSIL